MQKYKLKVEARQFFNDSYAKEIKDKDSWKNLGIPIELLNEVNNVYIQYGHEENLSKSTVTSLRSWDGHKQKAEFRFTIKVQDIDNENYNNCNIPKLMDEMQEVVNNFFKPLLNS